MMKWVRAAMAGGVIAAAYVCYAMFAVPWIEPAPSYASGQEIGPDTGPTKPLIDTESLFAADAWQNGDRCKTIETARGVLLYEDFSRDETGAITLKPMSLVFLRRDENSESEATEQEQDFSSAVILEAPEGAELRSDTGLDVARMQFGKIVGGQLKGEITMRSPQQTPPDKKLFLQTRDIRIDGRRIWTPHQVVFRFGESRGSGSNLVITTNETDERGETTNALGKVKSLELVTLNELVVSVKDSAGMPFGPSPTEPVSTRRAKETVPLRITCGGSLFYDFDDMTAKLDDQVQVIRENPRAAHDRLRCDELHLRFAQSKDDKTKNDAGETPLGGSWKLMGLKAVGGPEGAVVLEAPAHRAVAIGQSLEFDAATRRLVLRQPGGAAQLRYRDFDVRCPQVDYIVPLNPRRLGRLWAQGPGRIKGVWQDKKDQPFQASWKRMLQIEPRDSHHVLSLYEQVHMDIADGRSGVFDATRIHVYLDEKPKQTADGKTRYELIPLRMRALDGVAFNSPELSGETPELNVFFERPQASPIGDGPEFSSNLEAPWAASEDDEAERKFHVVGQKMELRVLTPHSGRPTLDDVTVAGAVDIRQTRLAEKDEHPLTLAGDVLRISSVSRDRNRLTVRGRPARVAVGPLSIEGGEIVFDQRTNELTVDGVGQMTFPSSQERPSETTTVAWRRGANFDGTVAHFHGEIVVAGSQTNRRDQRLKYHGESESAVATLNMRVDFRNRKPPKGVELARLILDGGVYFEHQLRSPTGKPLTHEKMQTNNLDADLIEGGFVVRGPGWGSTTRYSKNRFTRPAGGNPMDALVRSQEPRLTYLHVTFENGVRGNLYGKRALFDGSIVAIHGPIKSWGQTLDASQRGGLGPRGVELRCDQLEVIDVSATDDPLVELIATGNTIVENEMYGASAQRLSFTEAKNLIVLDGDSTFDAKLRVYGRNPKSAVAKRIKFWTDTYDFDVDRVQSIKLGSFGKPPASKPKPLKPGRLR